MHSYVQDWVNADYTITSNKPSNIKDSDLNYSGFILWDITKGSISEALGIQNGDILIRINGKMPHEDTIEHSKVKARTLGKYKFEIFNPATRSLKTIKARYWIYGAKYCRTPQEFARELRINNPEIRQCETFWLQGDAEGLALLYPAFEIYNHRMIHRDGEPYYKTDFTLPDYDAPLSEGVWHANYAFWALCAAKAGYYKRARYILDEVYDRVKKSSAGFPSSESSILAYTESLICSENKDDALAIDWMHTAIERARTLSVNYKRLSQLTGHEVNAPQSIFIDSRINYDLEEKFDPPRHDHAAQRFTLNAALQSLQNDQYLIVTLLGQYRSNYFHYEACRTSAVILDKLRSKFPIIHILSGGTYSLEAVFKEAEGYFDNHKIDYKTLNDENTKIADQMNIETAPTHLILNAKGDIIAEGDLSDGKILWEVLNAE